MEVTGFFESSVTILRWINVHQEILPKSVALIHAGEDEGRISERFILQDSKRFSKFIERHEQGFYLFNDAVSADIRLSSGRTKPSISYSLEDYRCSLLADQAPSIIRSYSEAEALLAWACLDEEFSYKNNVTVKLNIGTVESWVGRDITHYLPGIYWLTWISDKYEAMLNLSAKEIALKMDIPIHRVGKGNLLKLSDNPELWKDKLDAIKDIASENEKIFYVDKVDLSNVKTYHELQVATEKWK